MKGFSMEELKAILQSGLGIYFVPFFLLAGIYLVYQGFQYGPSLSALALGFVCIFLAVTFIVGYSETQPTCPACGEIVKTDYCTSCGEMVEENIEPTCPECGEVCRTNFCGHCGASCEMQTEPTISTIPICSTYGAECTTAFCGDCGAIMDLEEG